MKVLLEGNANPLVRDNRGTLPIDVARAKNHSAIVLLLEQAMWEPLVGSSDV